MFRPMSTAICFYWDHFRDFRINAPKMYIGFDSNTNDYAIYFNGQLNVVWFIIYFESATLSFSPFFLCDSFSPLDVPLSHSIPLVCWCSGEIGAELSSMESLLRWNDPSCSCCLMYSTLFSKFNWRRRRRSYRRCRHRFSVVFKNHASALQFWILIPKWLPCLYYTFGRREMCCSLFGEWPEERVWYCVWVKSSVIFQQNIMNYLDDFSMKNCNYPSHVMIFWYRKWYEINIYQLIVFFLFFFDTDASSGMCCQFDQRSKRNQWKIPFAIRLNLLKIE